MIKQHAVANLDLVSQIIPRLVVPHAVPTGGLVGLGKQVAEGIGFGFRFEQPVRHLSKQPPDNTGFMNHSGASMNQPVAVKALAANCLYQNRVRQSRDLSAAALDRARKKAGKTLGRFFLTLTFTPVNLLR